MRSWCGARRELRFACRKGADAIDHPVRGPHQHAAEPAPGRCRGRKKVYQKRYSIMGFLGRRGLCESANAGAWWEIHWGVKAWAVRGKGKLMTRRVRMWLTAQRQASNLYHGFLVQIASLSRVYNFLLRTLVTHLSLKKAGHFWFPTINLGSLEIRQSGSRGALSYISFGDTVTVLKEMAISSSCRHVEGNMTFFLQKGFDQKRGSIRKHRSWRHSWVKSVHHDLYQDRKFIWRPEVNASLYLTPDPNSAPGTWGCDISIRCSFVVVK